MKTLLTTLLLFLPLVATAQQGTVLYEERVKIQIELPPELQHMRDRIPTENTTMRQLLFDGAASLMKNPPSNRDEAPLEAESSSFQIRMSGAQSDDETYTNHDEGVHIEKRDFLGRTFLITGAPTELSWRLTGERAEFLGYMAQKAVATVRDSVTVEAWFTPEIPVPVGPAAYGGLPGLILVVTENEGRRSFVAKEVTLGELPAASIQAPTRGRSVTQEEFVAIMQERMREMGGPGGGTRFQIRTN